VSPPGSASRRTGAIELLAVAACSVLLGACNENPLTFPDQEEVCSFDTAREAARAASAAQFPAPSVATMRVNGIAVWNASTPPSTPPQLAPGDQITLTGTGFGNGPDIDFSKIMIGNTRVLETDLTMYKQQLDIQSQVNYEISQVLSSWDKDIISWSPTEIRFTVPDHASGGTLTVQIQKRTGYNESLLRNGESHNVIDAQTKRITADMYGHDCDVVSTLGETRATVPIAVNVSNPDFTAQVKHGRELFWSYDYNIGLAHTLRKLDWKKIFAYQTRDPITQTAADPALLFGAYPVVTSEVPAEAHEDVYFDPYPQPTPIPGFLTGPQLTKGNTRSSGWVGYRYAEASNPYKGPGEWIGFNCASCHSYRISYENAPGQTVTRVIPGLPNPRWSMKWTVLGDKAGATTATFDGIAGIEAGPAWSAGKASIDKTTLLYYMPAGAGEHNIVRMNGEGSETDNDYQFSPIAIPNVTHYMGIRRSLSHTESYVGFEGSYIHSEEPDGATGSMLAGDLKALTAYMTTLDAHDNDLRNAGLYRWLNSNGLLASQTGSTPSEGEFVQNGWQSYAGVASAVAQGKTIFDRDCGSCHRDSIGYNTTERMFRLDEVGRFFAPTIYQKDQQSIRATFLRDMYWTQHRGLLSDGHVRNLEDLVSPDRCTEGSTLYDQYYTLHAPVSPALGGPDFPEPYPADNRKGDVFRVPKTASATSSDTGGKRNRFIKRHKYFVEVPWDTTHYYWDYQKMRSEYGTYELGTTTPIGMPAAPHPWCAQSNGDVTALVQYVLTL
jgi:hypothetical protein